MGCNCGSKTSTAKVTWIAKFTDGTRMAYGSEIEAKAAVARKGGSYWASKDKR